MRGCVLLIAIVVASAVLASITTEDARATSDRLGAGAPQALSRVLLSGSISSFVIDPNRDRLYLSQAALNRIVIWNTTVDRFVANVTVTGTPSSLDLSADGTELYVVVPNLNRIAVVDLGSQTQTASIPLSATPVDIVAGRPGRAYVTTNEYWGYPRIVDTDGHREIGNVTAAGTLYQGSLARVSADRNFLYIAERGLSPASLHAFSISTDQVSRLSEPPFDSIGDNLGDVDVSTDGSQVFVASGWPYYVIGLHTGSWTPSVQLPTGPYPNSVSVDQRALYAFAAHSATDVLAFNVTNGTQIASYSFSQEVGKVRALRDGTKIYALTYGTEGRLEVAGTGLPPTSREPPLVRASAGRTYGWTPMSVAFRGSILLGTAPFNFSWNFGDGGTSFEASPVHTYTAVGSFVASLRIVDAAGYEARASVTVRTIPGPLPGPLQVSQQFAGIGLGLNNLWWPPDPQIAAGPDHLIEMVNVRVRIIAKDGTDVREMTGQRFFQVPDDEYISDPRILFDTMSDRWFATMFSITRGAVLLAVSSSPDPTLPWRVYTYQSEGCPDQPYVGVSSGLVILSANTFTSCLGASPTYAGAEHWVIGKAGLVSNTTNHFVHFSPDPRQKAVRPVHSLQPGPGYMVSVGDGETISTNLTLFEVQGVPPEPVTLAETVLTLHPFVQPRAAPQPSTTLPLDTVDSRIHDAFWDGSSLWLAFGSACPPEGNRSVRACLRIAEVDPSAALVRQDFAIADPDRDLFFAALRTDSSGNLIIPFAYSSESEYAGLMVTSHAKADPPNTFRQPVRIRAGTGADPYGCDANRCRYGDYFGAARDPVDPSLVWIVGEASMSVGWQTAIAGVGVFPSVGFTVSYSIVGGGTGWSPPMFTSYQAGLRTREPLPTSPEVRRLDRDSPWTVPAALDGSSAEERWATNSSAFGIAAEDLALPFLYVHQVWANVSGTPLRGGTVSPGSSWLDNGTFVDLRATPSAGWKFIGWTGEGAAAYSGVENPARITASGPIREVGEFWPGLTVSVTGHGSVLFTYRNITGIVEGGTTRTLYVPPGTSVLLSAAPSALSRFSAWSGAALSPINAVSLVVDGPLELGASFADDYFVLFTLVGPGAAITGVAAFVLLARRRRRRSTTSRQLTSASGPQEPAVSKRRSDGQGEFHR